jgi:integrase
LVNTPVGADLKHNGGAAEGASMASIHERKRRKGVVFMVSYRDPTGDQHTKSFARRRDAESFARRVEVDKEDGRWSDPAAGRISVEEFWSHFLATSHHLRPTTRALYETHGKYILAAFGNRKLSSIRKPDVKEFVSDLVLEGKGQATLVQVIKLLRRLLQVAVEEERIARNPAHDVTVPQPIRRDARYLSSEEVDAIAEEIAPRYRTLVYFLAYTGLRIGEASALRVRNLDLAEGVLRVVESSPEVAGRKVTGETKTRKGRAVHVGPQLRQMLKEHLTRYGRPLDPDAFVFTGDRNAQIRQNAFRSRIFQPAARRAGIHPTPTVHDLRHTAASLMAKSGYSLREAQEELGHSHTTMTDRYTHLFPSDAEERVARLDSLILRTTPSTS